MLVEAHKIVQALIPPLYFGRPDLLALFVYTSVNLSLTHGICPPGAANFVAHGLVLQSKAPRAAYGFGKMAIKLLEAYNREDPLLCSTYKIFGSHIQVWNEPIRDTASSFLEAVSSGIRSHNAEYTAYGATELCVYSFIAGQDLRVLESQCRTYATLLTRFRQEIGSIYLAIPHQALVNILHCSPDQILRATGEILSEGALEFLESRSVALHIHMYHLLRLIVAVFVEDWAEARISALKAREYLFGVSYHCISLTRSDFFVFVGTRNSVSGRVSTV